MTWASGDLRIAIAVAAMILAAVGGYALHKAYSLLSKRSKLKREMELLEGAGEEKSAARAIGGDRSTAQVLLVKWAMRISHRIERERSEGRHQRTMPKSRWYKESFHTTGLSTSITNDAFVQCEIALGIALAALGALLGAAFSWQMSIILAISAGAVGFLLPKRVFSKISEERVDELEHHLPELLDVVSLGMRSGMSFDSSLLLYTRRFDNCLSNDWQRAFGKWSNGLERREDAIRQLCRSYDSSMLTQVGDTIIRSLRFGSTMASDLEHLAKESRSYYRAKRQEAVARAPVKMMVPTATLILPAMLLLVLGPVLLELMGGGL